MERVLRAVLFGSGLRVAPICGLKVGRRERGASAAARRREGAKIQVVPIQPELRDPIVSYALAADRLLEVKW